MTKTQNENEVKGLFAVPKSLPEPKNEKFTTEELKNYSGENNQNPIYVAVKGTVFDVTSKKEMYGPGGSYHVFAGKDASKALGKSSLDPADAESDYSQLTADELNTLNEWEAFFMKRYPVIGKVIKE